MSQLFIFRLKVEYSAAAQTNTLRANGYLPPQMSQFGIRGPASGTASTTGAVPLPGAQSESKKVVPEGARYCGRHCLCGRTQGTRTWCVVRGVACVACILWTRGVHGAGRLWRGVGQEGPWTDDALEGKRAEKGFKSGCKSSCRSGYPWYEQRLGGNVRRV